MIHWMKVPEFTMQFLSLTDKNLSVKSHLTLYYDEIWSLNVTWCHQVLKHTYVVLWLQYFLAVLYLLSDLHITVLQKRKPTWFQVASDMQGAGTSAKEVPSTWYCSDPLLLATLLPSQNGSGWKQPEWVI